ncbi:type II toxin-antitoxin system RelE/ParE family toxin [Microbacterium sp. Kw_RZR3]|uniref:type II toxin-antitoxin system RelE/ParE family toxin n=1 Tax=Microbacterium sp. Kw_RZR3 TaxID=3032903 RepID=UPI0023D99424|nr:type II toxin-antitoxin system RelE/ParE family toxin [Microbacterium sp. Kw_RZR3]MDF2047758.1 type II toxin-antitoxin system RelE/ParE family toxin [Microbacterium sp. Kw_RZR3]
MQLRYANADLERVCTDERQMQKRFGVPVAKALKLRLFDLRATTDMPLLLQGRGRWEELHGNRAGQWSARLSPNWRLIVDPDGDDATVLIVEIVDYHRK